MTNTLVNAAPMMRSFGTEDVSTRVLPRVPDNLPQHLPKCYFYAERGNTKENLRTGAEALRTYGTKTFDERSKYANHATVFANAFIARGNACVFKRIVPEDAGPQANLTLWLDVLPTKVDLYERNIDGSIKTDNLGQPIVIGTADGFKVKWVSTHSATHADFQNFGLRSITNGNQVDTDTGTQSQRYPIAEGALDSQGSYGNNLGWRIWAPVSQTSRLPTRMMNTEFAYPFNLSIIEKPDRLTTPNVVETAMGEQYVSMVLKPNVVDPATDRLMYAGEVFLPSYSDNTDPRYPEIDPAFSKFKLYDDNIAALLEMFHAAEAPFIDNQSDFTEDPEQMYLFNIFSGVDSNNRRYHSYAFNDAADAIRLTQYTNIYADGGSDGTMSDVNFGNLVAQDVQRYLDPYDEIQDIPGHPEAFLYDSGFPLENKLDLASFIGRRRDTFVHMGTHTAGGPALDALEEYSVAVALRTRLRLYPESEYFGTSTCRGMITGFSGRIRNSRYKGRLPLTYEVACKSADYMGASDGRWVNGKAFGGAPGHILENMFDINITNVPEPVRNRNWDVGLNWVQRFDLHSFFFPAFKTVYDEDTSVLNSYTMAAAICYINKVAHRVWATFTGRDDLSPLQLTDQVNTEFRRLVEGKFDGRFIIEPVATITEMDALRGFSWTLPVRIFGNNLPTVQTTYTQVYRMSDAAAIVGTPVSSTLGG